MTGIPVEILMVDDNAADVRLMLEALADAKVLNNMHVSEDGIEALEYLRGTQTNGTRPDPHLILLDLNMPRMDGRELLVELKGDASLRRIPVVVLTTSAAEQDIVQSYDLHANAYVTKPVDLDSFMEVIKAIEGFWLEVVKLPGRGLPS